MFKKNTLKKTSTVLWSRLTPLKYFAAQRCHFFGEFDAWGARSAWWAAVGGGGVARGGPDMLASVSVFGLQSFGPSVLWSLGLPVSRLSIYSQSEYVLQLCRQDVDANCSHSSTFEIRWGFEWGFGWRLGCRVRSTVWMRFGPLSWALGANGQ